MANYTPFAFIPLRIRIKILILRVERCLCVFWERQIFKSRLHFLVCVANLLTNRLGWETPRFVLWEQCVSEEVGRS